LLLAAFSFGESRLKTRPAKQISADSSQPEEISALPKKTLRDIPR
jgi:hypothetical protein